MDSHTSPSAAASMAPPPAAAPATPHAAWGWWACALAMVTVGSTVVASRLISTEVPPFLATALRHGMALPFLIALMWAWRQPWPRWAGTSVHDRWLLLAQAAAGSVGYGVLMLLGLRVASAADAGILVGTLPAMAGLLAAVVLRERLGRSMWVALALATLGVMALALGAQAGPGTDSRIDHPHNSGSLTASARALGVGLLLAAVACEAAFILLHKRLQRPLPALPQSLLMSALGALLAGAAACAEAFLQPAPLSLSSTAWGSLLYYAVVPTVGGFLLWYSGSARLRPSQAALTTAVAPVAALGLSVLVLGETVSPAQWLGLGAVLASIGLGVRRT